MAFSDTPNRLEAVFVQRDTTNVRYDQINVSGSNLIVYLDENGKINADKVSVFADKYGLSSGSISGSVATASFAISASYAPGSPSISASYALTASYAYTSSHAIWANTSSYFSGSQITASSILTNLILPLGSSIGNSTQSFSTIYVTKMFGTASEATRSITALTASSVNFVPLYSVSASWASHSLSASYAPGSPSISASYSLTASYALNGGSGGTASYALTASVGFASLDSNMPTKVPFFSQENTLSASKISITNGLTTNLYSDSHVSPPMERVVYIGRDGNVNTWAALGFYNDAGGVNAKYWLNYADQANAMEFAVAADDFSIISPWLTITRSGSAVTQILFQRAITIAGNILPSTNLTHSLGTASLQWKSAWIQNVFGTASAATLAYTASSINFTPVTAISASWASSSISASYAPGNPSISASYAETSSYSYNAATASLLLGSIESASYALSASYSISSSISIVSISASYASTSSHAFSSLITVSASFASASNSSSFITASNVFGTVLSSSWAFSASYAPGNPSISASYAETSSFSFSSLTSSFTLGTISNANQAISASWASSSISSSYSLRSTTASYALTASLLLGTIENATQAISASWASSSLSASYVLTSSYPWAVSAGSPNHINKPVGIGTSTPIATGLSILDLGSSSISQSVLTVHGYRTDTSPVSIDVRNLTAAANANSRASVFLSLGTSGSLEGGVVFVTRTATPSYGIVNGINISPSSAAGDVGIRTGLALSGSVAGPQLQIKSDGTIGMGVASPTNARLHIGGTDLAFYNATIRLTNGSAGGADVYLASTDDAWGGSVTGKFLIGSGDPSSGNPIVQLYPASASVGIGIANNVQPQAKLHVQGNISASVVTASLNGTASWATNSITASISSTASYALESLSASYAPSIPSQFSVSASWASQSLSSSYSVTSSYSLQAISASYAPGSPAISASYALTASYALNAAGTAASSRNMVLCAGFTPYLTGADAAEIPVPYSSDGITALSWSVNRVNLRVQLSGSTTSSISIEKSSGNDIFSPTFVTSMSLAASSYQIFTGSLVGVVSGDKVRFNVATIGTAQYWTITAEITSL